MHGDRVKAIEGTCRTSKFRRGRTNAEDSQERCGSYFGEKSVTEVNPLCGQRRSLLAETGSSNNHTMILRKFLITNKR